MSKCDAIIKTAKEITKLNTEIENIKGNYSNLRNYFSQYEKGYETIRDGVPEGTRVVPAGLYCETYIHIETKVSHHYESPGHRMQVGSFTPKKSLTIPPHVLIRIADVCEKEELEPLQRELQRLTNCPDKSSSFWEKLI